MKTEVEIEKLKKLDIEYKKLKEQVNYIRRKRTQIRRQYCEKIDDILFKYIKNIGRNVHGQYVLYSNYRPDVVTHEIVVLELIQLPFVHEVRLQENTNWLYVCWEKKDT